MSYINTTINSSGSKLGKLSQIKFTREHLLVGNLLKYYHGKHTYFLACTVKYVDHRAWRTLLLLDQVSGILIQQRAEISSPAPRYFYE